MKRLQIPQKLVYKKIHVHKKILPTRNYMKILPYRRKFIRNVLPEKRKESM